MKNYALLLTMALTTGLASCSQETENRDRDIRQPNEISWQLPPEQSEWSYNIGTSKDINSGILPSGQVVSVDLYNTETGAIKNLKSNGKYAICYYSAGSSETYRTDDMSRRLLSPELNLGEVKRGEDDVWAGERWLDIRGFESNDSSRIRIIKEIMSARLDLARQKGCQAVEPDNVDAWANTVNQNAPTGTPMNAISADDQLAYNRWTANAAHARGLAVLLKNDLDQIPQLEKFYDGALNEECFDFQDDCKALMPFRDAKKAIYVVLYHTTSYANDAMKQMANELHLNVILTDPNAYRLNPYLRFGNW